MEPDSEEATPERQFTISYSQHYARPQSLQNSPANSQVGSLHHLVLTLDSSSHSILQQWHARIARLRHHSPVMTYSPSRCCAAGSQCSALLRMLMALGTSCVPSWGATAAVCCNAGQPCTGGHCRPRPGPSSRGRAKRGQKQQLWGRSCGGQQKRPCGCSPGGGGGQDHPRARSGNPGGAQQAVPRVPAQGGLQGGPAGGIPVKAQVYPGRLGRAELPELPNPAPDILGMSGVGFGCWWPAGPCTAAPQSLSTSCKAVQIEGKCMANDDLVARPLHAIRPQPSGNGGQHAE